MRLLLCATRLTSVVDAQPASERSGLERIGAAD
jgi:hypothetical protein